MPSHTTRSCPGSTSATWSLGSDRSATSSAKSCEARSGGRSGGSRRASGETVDEALSGGVRWDEEAGAITVALEGLEHRIRSPLVVWAHVNMGGAVRSLNILGGPGCRDEVTFRMADLLRPGAA